MSDSKTVKATRDAAVHKQKRAVVTRQELLYSARKVFSANGFELARIEDIAAYAHKTRGAFYANFKNKEDVFFAILEDDLDRDVAELTRLLSRFSTLDERIDALSRYLSDIGRERQRTLLYLEFKLYAIRHPRKRQRLANLHAMMRKRCSLSQINDLLPEELRKSLRDQVSGSLAIGAVIEGLSVNQLFDPEALDDLQFASYLKLCIRESLSPQCSC